MLVTEAGTLVTVPLAEGYAIKIVFSLFNNIPSSDEYVVLFSLTLIFNELPLTNAPSPMVFTEAGIFMLVKLLQQLNAATPMVSSPSTPLRSRFTFLFSSFNFSASVDKLSELHSPVATRVWGPTPESPAITEATVSDVIPIPHLA